MDGHIFPLWLINSTNSPGGGADEKKAAEYSDLFEKGLYLLIVVLGIVLLAVLCSGTCCSLCSIYYHRQMDYLHGWTDNRETRPLLLPPARSILSPPPGNFYGSIPRDDPPKYEDLEQPPKYSSLFPAASFYA